MPQPPQEPGGTGTATPRPEDPTRIVLRPPAGGLPLGFLAFGTGRVLLAAAQPHWVPRTETEPLMVLVPAFAVPLELLAGVPASLARDGGAASALSVLGCTWAGAALVRLQRGPVPAALAGGAGVAGPLGHMLGGLRAQPSHVAHPSATSSGHSAACSVASRTAFRATLPAGDTFRVFCVFCVFRSFCT